MTQTHVAPIPAELNMAEFFYAFSDRPNRLVKHLLDRPDFAKKRDLLFKLLSMLPNEIRLDALRNALDPEHPMSLLKFPAAKLNMEINWAQLRKQLGGLELAKLPLPEPEDPTLVTFKKFEPLKQIMARPLLDLINDFITNETERDRIFTALNERFSHRLREDRNIMEEWIKTAGTSKTLSFANATPLQVILSLAYYYGVGVPLQGSDFLHAQYNKENVHQIIRMCKDQNDPFILTLKGMLYYVGVDECVPQDWETAKKMYSEAGNLGCSIALVHAGKLLFKMKDYKGATDSYVRAAKLGDPHALYNLADEFMLSRLQTVSYYNAVLAAMPEAVNLTQTVKDKLYAVLADADPATTYQLIQENLITPEHYSTLLTKLKSSLYNFFLTLSLTEQKVLLPRMLDKNDPIGKVIALRPRLMPFIPNTILQKLELFHELIKREPYHAQSFNVKNLINVLLENPQVFRFFFYEYLILRETINASPNHAGPILDMIITDRDFFNQIFSTVPPEDILKDLPNFSALILICKKFYSNTVTLTNENQNSAPKAELQPVPPLPEPNAALQLIDISLEDTSSLYPIFDISTANPKETMKSSLQITLFRRKKEDYMKELAEVFPTPGVTKS